MKKLPESYKKNGYEFNLIERRGDVCLSRHVDACGLVFYEVFKVQKKPKRHINGKVMEAREVTPSNEQWGEKGNTYRNFDEAMNRLVELHERSRDRQYKLDFPFEPVS